MVVSIPASSVWPSGSDFATSCAPIAVLAPGRFSITTGWPQSSLIFCPVRRAMMSAGPPGGNGTTMRTARLGKPLASWAAAEAAAASASATMTAPAVRHIGALNRA